MQLKFLFEEADCDNSAVKLYCPSSENILSAFT